MRTKLNIFLIVATAFIMYSCSPEEDVTSGASYIPDDSKPVSVEALTVSQGKLVSRVSGSGIIRGEEEVWSISENSGTVEQVFVSPGEYVEKGAALLKMDDNLAYWDMERARQQLETATFEYEGTKDSYESGAVSKVEYNRSYSAWFNSKSAFELALKNYENCTLRAPIDGYIAQMDTSLTTGNVINRGTPFLKIVSRDSYILEIAPGQREVGLIGANSPAVIYVELADKTIENPGRVLDISAGSIENTGSFPVRVIWENTQGSQVLPGMTARVEIEAINGREALIIPYDRIIEREGKDWVFVAVTEKDGVVPVENEGYVLAKEITTGPRLGNLVLIEEGLKEGDVLITSGFTSLQPGVQVSVSLLGNTGGTK